jgi:hypothetical protein
MSSCPNEVQIRWISSTTRPIRMEYFYCRYISLIYFIQHE